MRERENSDVCGVRLRSAIVMSRGRAIASWPLSSDTNCSTGIFDNRRSERVLMWILEEGTSASRSGFFLFFLGGATMAYAWNPLGDWSLLPVIQHLSDMSNIDISSACQLHVPFVLLWSQLHSACRGRPCWATIRFLDRHAEVTHLHSPCPSHTILQMN